MLGANYGHIPNPAEELALLLDPQKYSYLLFSSRLNRYARWMEILWSLVRFRHWTTIVSIQVFGGPSFFAEDLTSLIAHKLKLRLIMVLHGGGIPDFYVKYPNWSHRVLRRAHHLVTPSNYIKQELAGTDFMLEVIPNGIDIKRYKFRPRLNPEKNLIWLRAFHAIYQPQMAVEVLARLLTDFQDLRLTMIGPSYEDGALDATKLLAEKFGIINHIHFVGYVPKAELPNWLDSGGIFLNTTRYESFGISVMEAAACGLPIVTTDVGELPFLWQNDRNSLTVGVDDIDGMTHAVRRILTEPNLAARLSMSARQTAEQYDWDNIRPQWEALFNGLMN